MCGSFSLVPSPSSPLTPLAYLAFSAEFQITGRSFFFSLFISSLFGLCLLRMDERVYYLLMLRGNVARQRDQDGRFENLFQYIVVLYEIIFINPRRTKKKVLPKSFENPSKSFRDARISRFFDENQSES